MARCTVCGNDTPLELDEAWRLPPYVCPSCALRAFTRFTQPVELFYNHLGYFFMELGELTDAPAWDLLQLGAHTFERPHRTTRLRYLGLPSYGRGKNATIVFKRVGRDATET
jgi:hypothetical protein